jgi:type IV secretion system protein TrbF
MLKFLQPQARTIATLPAARAAEPVSVPPAPVSERSAVTRSSPENNPYLEARREWNERYGDYIKQAHHWRTVAIICSLVSFVSVAGIVYIGSQGKMVPYVVEVDKLGQVAAVGRADRAHDVDSPVIKSYLARFVTDWRTVSTDRHAEQVFVDRAYAMLPAGSIAQQKLNEYFKSHNPFALGGTLSVSVKVTNILPISNTTWQVEWEEVTRDNRGTVQSDTRMKVSILIALKPPTEERLILVNPLGVYVRDLNWAQQI